MFLEAVKLGNLELVRFLVSEGMKHDDAVWKAAENDNFEMVRFLVSNGMKDDFAGGS